MNHAHKGKDLRDGTNTSEAFGMVCRGNHSTRTTNVFCGTQHFTVNGEVRVFGRAKTSQPAYGRGCDERIEIHHLRPLGVLQVHPEERSDHLSEKFPFLQVLGGRPPRQVINYG